MYKRDHMPAAGYGCQISLGMAMITILSVLCAAGFVSPGRADAAVSVVNQFGDTAQPCVGSTGSSTSNITCSAPAIGAGTNRVLVLVITGEAGGNHTSVTVNAGYGAASFTEVQNSFGGGTNRRFAWIGYINQQQLADNAGSNITASVTSNQTWAGIEAYFAVYDGVDQGGGTSTVPGSAQANSSTSTAVSMGPIAAASGGAAIYASSENSTTGNTTVPANYTENVNQADSSSNYLNAIGSRVTTPGTTEAVAYTATNVRWCAVFMTLGAAPSGPPGTLQFSLANYPANEGSGTVTITVTRTGGSSGAASVNFATSDGTAVQPLDYTITSGTLNWSDGDAADKTFTVTIIDDPASEPDETFNLVLSGPSGASLGSPNSATATILANDGAPAAVPAGSWPLYGTVMAGIVVYGLVWRRTRGETAS